MTSHLRCGGVILCGGQSRRMGLAKATLPFGDERMLQRVVRLLVAEVAPIVVVAARGQPLPPLPADVTRVDDQRQSEGPLEGLRVGLAALGDRADAAYVTSCDVPLLVGGVVRRMIERLGDYAVAVPFDEQFHHPLAAVYRTSATSAIENLLAAGRRRPVFLFDELPTCRVPVDELRDVDPRLDTLRNLNRPEDYYAALADAGLPVPDDVRNKLEGMGE